MNEISKEELEILLQKYPQLTENRELKKEIKKLKDKIKTLEKPKKFTHKMKNVYCDNIKRYENFDVIVENSNWIYLNFIKRILIKVENENPTEKKISECIELIKILQSENIHKNIEIL